VAILCDKASPHRTKAVEGFLQDNGGDRIIYLPRGSLYLNPVEACCKEGKRMLLVSEYYDMVSAFAGAISTDFQAIRFRRDLFAYLNRSAERYLKNL